MTEHLTSINLSELSKIRFTCKECNTKVEFSISEAQNVIEEGSYKCRFCGGGGFDRITHDHIGKLRDAIQSLSASKVGCSIDFILQAESKPQG